MNFFGLFGDKDDKSEIDVKKSYEKTKKTLYSIKKVDKTLVKKFMENIKKRGIVYASQKSVKNDYFNFVERLEKDQIEKAKKMSTKARSSDRHKQHISSAGGSASAHLKNEQTSLTWFLNLVSIYGAEILADVTQREEFRKLTNKEVRRRFDEAILKRTSSKARSGRELSYNDQIQMAMALSLNEKQRHQEEDVSLRKSSMPIGMQNTGNSCYSNSVLQILYNYPEFLRAICAFRVAEDGVEHAAQADEPLETNEHELQLEEYKEPGPETKADSSHKDEDKNTDSQIVEKDSLTGIKKKVDIKTQDERSDPKAAPNRSKKTTKISKEKTPINERERQGIELIRDLQKTFGIMMKSKKLSINPRSIFDRIINPQTGEKFVSGNQKDAVEFFDIFFESIAHGLKHDRSVSGRTA